MLRPRARSALQTSRPSRPGIIRSSTSRSLARSLWLASAAVPSATAVDLVAGAAQVHHQQVADVGLVFGDEDGGGRHDGIVSAAARSLTGGVLHAM